jgi:twitching motility protein PilT
MSELEGVPVPDQIRDWLIHAVEAGASDVHLVAGHPPVLRLHGDLVQMSEPPLEADETYSLLSSLCRPEAFTRLQAQKSVDFSFGLVVKGRVNRFRAKKSSMHFTGFPSIKCWRSRTSYFS